MKDILTQQKYERLREFLQERRAKFVEDLEKCRACVKCICRDMEFTEVLKRFIRLDMEPLIICRNGLLIEHVQYSLFSVALYEINIVRGHDNNQW